MRKGHGFRDYLCPMSLAIKGGYFEMDGKFGRVLFLRSYANFINDELISDLAALPRNLMLTIGFIPVPTDEAVKELQNKLLSAETNIAQWQRKQNQANNFSSASLTTWSSSGRKPRNSSTTFRPGSADAVYAGFHRPSCGQQSPA